MRTSILTSTLALALWLAPATLRTTWAQPASTATSEPARVIVQYRADPGAARKVVQAVGAARAQALGQRLGIVLAAGQPIAERAEVVFADGMSSAALAARLSADPGVEYAVPDERRRATVVPNDPRYAGTPYNNPALPSSGGPLVGQWYLKPPGPATAAATASTSNTAPSAINAEGAWDITTGSASVVVAVLDTGIRFDHEDFRTQAGGGNLLPGYDMVSRDADGSFTTANDGGGRDADASDPGDFVTSADVGKGGCTANDVGPSSWHGTQTAGLIGAVTDNAIGIASVGRNVRILPVRVLGKCGGYDSDIIAGMRWAAGLPVPNAGLPENPNKARVINLSLGGAGTCSRPYQDLMTELTAAGAVVVAAAGNSAGHAVSTPANCPGVIGVAGLRHIGSKVGFSDLGPQIAISAPGGNCVGITAGAPCLYPIVTTTNSGQTTPVAHGAGGSVYTDSFRATFGTSFSAPLVAGTAALMLSAQSALTPDEVRYKLQQTARPFPTSAVDEAGAAVPVCTAPSNADQLQCVCRTGLCGSGMLDTAGAVRAAAGVQARITANPESPQAGQLVTLDATPSLLPPGRSIVAYQWTLTSGGGIVAALNEPTNGPSVTATPSGAGSFIVTLTTTDNTGVVSAQSRTVTVRAAGDPGSGSGTPDDGTGASPPGGSDGSEAQSGGGGALDAAWTMLLVLAVMGLGGLRRSRRA